MFKIFLSIFISSNAVISLVEGSFQPYSLIKNGAINRSSNFAHSFYHKAIDCEKIPTWRSEYAKLSKYITPLPKILEVLEVPDQNIECHIFFQNLFNIDLKIFRNTASLITSFKRLLSSLEKDNNYQYFDISSKSFAYSPSTRSFVFVDIEKLETLDVHSKDKATFKKEMATRFLNSLKLEEISLSTFDLLEFKDLNVDVSMFPVVLTYSNRLREISIYHDIKLQQNLKFPSSFTIEVEFQPNFNKFDFNILHNNKITTFSTIRIIDTFIVYVCREQNSFVVECMNIQVKLSNLKFSETFNISSKDRLDIQVQESLAQINNWNLIDEKNTRRFYEIFIMIRHFNAFGISDSQHYFNQNSSFDIRDNDLILCETTSQKMIIYYTQDNQPKVQDYLMSYQAIKFENRNLKNIVQISPYLLTNKSFLFPEQVTRIFYIHQGAKQSLFVKEKYFKRIQSISFFSYNIGNELLIINECENSISDISIQLKNEHMILFHSRKIKKYPSPIVMMSDSSNQSVQYKICQETCSEGYSSLTFDMGKGNIGYFDWNFNSHDKPDHDNFRQNIVYLKSNYSNDDFTFIFNNFAWPIARKYVLFISILKQKSSDQYSSQVAFYKNDEKVYNILNSDKIELPFKRLPDKLIYSKDNSRSSDSLVRQSFSNYDAVYLSENEVVYQLEVPNFKKCDPVLLLEDDTNLKIHCEFCVFNCDGTRLADANLSPGLKRVTSQIHPFISKKLRVII